MIKENGFYDLSLDDYHGQPCEGVSVSSTDLRSIVSTCPAKWWAYASANPERHERKSTPAMNLGSAIHAYLMDQAEWDARFVLSEYDAYRSNEAKAWKAEQEEAGKIIITKDQLEHIKAMADALSADQYARAAIEKATPERSMIYKDKATGLWIKARPDLLPEAQGAFIKDLKTTSKTIEPKAYSRDVFNMGSHQQAALAVDGYKALTGETPAGFAHIAIETEPPYLVGLRVFDVDHIDYGRKQNRQALDAIAKGLETGDWPGYADIEMIQTPRWVEKEMESATNEPANDQDGFDATEYAATI